MHRGPGKAVKRGRRRKEMRKERRRAAEVEKLSFE